MKGVILAAGKGSRLYPITHRIAKPLLPLANKPTLHYAFDKLRELKITDVCIVVGENETQMREALGNGNELGMELSYVRQLEPKGLAHAVSFAEEFVAGDDFALLLGDSIFESSFVPLRERFEEAKPANLNLVMEVEDPRRFGVANLDGERILKLVEKPAVAESKFAMAGVYFFDRTLWSVLPELKPSARGEYEITDAIQLLINHDHSVLAKELKGAWFDTGTLDSFLECNGWLIGNGVKIGSGATVLGDVGSSVVIGEGASVSCASISDSVVLPGARIECKGNISHSILAGLVSASEDINGAILDGLAN